MNSDILSPDFTVKSLEEEYTSWRNQFDFDKLIKCLWTPSQVESFWSAANWSENNVRKIRELLLKVHKLHPHLKRVAAIIYQLKRFLLLDSHCFHLLRPSSLEHHFGHQEVSLKNVIESSKSFVKELNRFSKLRTLRIQQMKCSLSQLQSTPEPGTIYQQAADRIISSEGLTGPSVAGVRRSEESQVQKEIENPVFLHEQIVKSWGLT